MKINYNSGLITITKNGLAIKLDRDDEKQLLAYLLDGICRMCYKGLNDSELFCPECQRKIEHK